MAKNSEIIKDLYKIAQIADENGDHILADALNAVIYASVSEKMEKDSQPKGLMRPGEQLSFEKIPNTNAPVSPSIKNERLIRSEEPFSLEKMPSKIPTGVIKSNGLYLLQKPGVWVDAQNKPNSSRLQQGTPFALVPGSNPTPDPSGKGTVWINISAKTANGSTTTGWVDKSGLTMGNVNQRSDFAPGGEGATQQNDYNVPQEDLLQNMIQLRGNR